MKRRATEKDSRRVESSKRKRSPSDRARKARRVAERIDAAACERQAAWGGVGDERSANKTHRLTRELDQAFEDLRAASTGLGAPYAGRTTAPYSQPPKPVPASAPGKWPTHQTRNDERPVATRASRANLGRRDGDDRVPV